MTENSTWLSTLQVGMVNELYYCVKIYTNLLANMSTQSVCSELGGTQFFLYYTNQIVSIEFQYQFILIGFLI